MASSLVLATSVDIAGATVLRSSSPDPFYTSRLIDLSGVNDIATGAVPVTGNSVYGDKVALTTTAGIGMQAALGGSIVAYVPAAGGALSLASVVATAGSQASSGTAAVTLYQAGGAGTVITYGAAGHVGYENFLVSTDTVQSFLILGSGSQQWGAGGSTALDVQQSRTAAGTLTVQGIGGATGSLLIVKMVAAQSTDALQVTSSAPTTLFKITSDGSVDTTGFVRATGYPSPTTGLGVEIGYTGGIGFVQAYNRTGLVALPLSITGTTIGMTGTGLITITGAGTLVTGLAIGNVVLAAKGVAAQTGDLFQAQNSGGTPLARVDSSGNLAANAGTLGAVQASVGATGTVTPNLANGSVLQYSLTGNTTIANPTSAPPVGGMLTIIFTQDGTGGRTVTWGTNFVQNPVVLAQALAVTVCHFVNTGTNLAPVWVLLKPQAMLYQKFTANGTWIVPVGVTQVRLRAISGGGGGGGGGTATAVLEAGGGGGSGGTIIDVEVQVVAGHTLTMTVGAGGTAGTAGPANGNPGGNGGNGGQTTVVDTTSSTTLAATGAAKGGAGSAANSTTAVGGGLYGNGNTATNGALMWPGSGGPSGGVTPSAMLAVCGGGGGGAATGTSNGGGGGGAATSTGTIGVQVAGVNGASGTGAGVAGVTATQPGCGGGGGGGAESTTLTGGAGGVGANGLVEIWW